MLIVVADTETTGLDPQDEIIELGLVRVDDDPDPWPTSEGFQITGWADSLVRSGRDIVPEARAAHHIHPEDVLSAPTLRQVLNRMWPDDASYIAAHNADFDRQFLEQHVPSVPWICTWRCARHLWPEAPRFSNQVLRYWLGVSAEPPTHHPHRALYDAWVTAHLLLRMLQLRTPDELVELSTKPALLHKVGFGQHRELTWDQVPRSYLQWMIRQGEEAWDKDTWHTATHWWDQER